MAGRKTRRGRSSSSTRKRASSPRTSWRKSTLRVSARPTKADVQTSEALGSFCCLSFHRCIQHHGYISVTRAHSRKHTHLNDDRVHRVVFHQHLFHNKGNFSLTTLMCLVLHTVLLLSFHFRELFDFIK